jgi:hypothetical protein
MGMIVVFSMILSMVESRQFETNLTALTLSVTA